MVEAPSNRVLIVAISVMAIYATLTGFMPPEFVNGQHQFRQTTYADFYESSDIEALATTYVQNITYGSGLFSDYWGLDEGFGHSFLYVTGSSTSYGANWTMSNSHYYPFYFIVEWVTGIHQMDWTSKDTGVTYYGHVNDLQFDECAIISEGDSYNLTVARFLVTCEHLTMHANIFYNSTAYSNSVEAWQDDGLRCEFAIEWDELGTGLNGWNLISAVLWFQAPDIHPYINFFIAFPLWVDIAIIVYCLVMATLDVIIPL